MSQLSKAELRFYYELIHTPGGIPASRIGKNWELAPFLRAEAIEFKPRGAGGVYIGDPAFIRSVLKVHFEIPDLDAAIAQIGGFASKGEIALAAGHTKAIGQKSGRRHIGLRACSSSAITLNHEGGSIEISNLPGVLLQLPEDIFENLAFKAHPQFSAVICENQEDYQTLTPKILKSLHKEPLHPTLLFWRNDNIEAIIRLLKHLGITKLYHYGDFDLCGVQIFESSTLKHASNAQMLFCEELLEDMIINHGSRKLFHQQLDRTRGFNPISEEGQKIAQIIRKHRKVIEQETVNQLLSHIK